MPSPGMNAAVRDAGSRLVVGAFEEDVASFNFGDDVHRLTHGTTAVLLLMLGRAGKLLVC